jgi:hypothetical protein
MNIFVLDTNPITAARMHCDKHIPKMCVEVAQMMASALRRHGATDEQMPLTKKGTPYKGHHPCTVWAGDSRDNFGWLALHGVELLREYDRRFNNVDVHACHAPIHTMLKMILLIPTGDLTPFAQAMPDEYRNDDPVVAYRAYYHSKQFAKWEKGTPAPHTYGIAHKH